uniref:HotDog ACOT-type domain-containing protein n=1 Tax=Ascaris lumbricoides TaxID=6252 RepID=A0A0M3HYB3_ASCLU
MKTASVNVLSYTNSVIIRIAFLAQKRVMEDEGAMHITARCLTFHDHANPAGTAGGEEREMLQARQHVIPFEMSTP